MLVGEIIKILLYKSILTFIKIAICVSSFGIDQMLHIDIIHLPIFFRVT